MERDQIVALLQVVQGYDNRTIDRSMVSSWMQAATRGRWKPDTAEDAVHEHYAASTDWLMPGHVTARVRASARQPAPIADLRAVEAPRPASEETRRKCMEQIRQLAEKKGIEHGIR